MVQPVRAASVRPVIVMVRRHPRKVGVKWMLRQDIMLVLRTVQHKQPVRRVHIKRRIRLHMVLRHLVRHAVGAQSTVRRVRQRAKRYPADTIQPDVTPVVITVPANHNARVQRIAAVVFRTVAQHKHRVGHVMGVLGGLLILSAIKHVRQHRSVHTAVRVN